MTHSPSVKLRAYLALTAAGTIAALTLGRPELVALAAPFAAYVAVGSILGRRPQVSLEPVVGRDRLLEGDQLEVTVRAHASAELVLALQLGLGRGLVVANGTRVRTIRLDAGESRELSFALHARRWGAPRIGSLDAIIRDRFGLFDYALERVALPSIPIFPRMETVSELVAPLELQATTGSRVARDLGDGIEFAEVRPMRPGDRLRRVNWRVTARRGTPYVSDRHPERNADAILFLDTFAEVGDAYGTTLDLTVRAAATLAAGYLARKDRVGVVGFGGVLSGLEPRLGTAGLYRILDVLLGSEVVFSYAHKDVSFVPRRMLPPKALVIAITPLIDQRSIGALLDLRARGFDLSVLEISPAPFTPAGTEPSEALAYRLWLLERDAIRGRFEGLGVPVTQWNGDQPLQVPLLSASAYRRRSRRAVAA